MVLKAQMITKIPKFMDDVKSALSCPPICIRLSKKQGRIHGYLSRVRVGRGGEKKLSVTDRPTDRWTEWVVEYA